MKGKDKDTTITNTSLDFPSQSFYSESSYKWTVGCVGTAIKDSTLIGFKPYYDAVEEVTGVKLTQPIDGATVAPNLPIRFKWQGNCNTYKISIGDLLVTPSGGEYFTSDYDTTTTAKEYVLNRPLNPNSHYDWRITCKNLPSRFFTFKTSANVYTIPNDLAGIYQGEAYEEPKSIDGRIVSDIKQSADVTVIISSDQQYLGISGTTYTQLDSRSYKLYSRSSTNVIYRAATLSSCGLGTCSYSDFNRVTIDFSSCPYKMSVSHIDLYDLVQFPAFRGTKQ